MLRRLLPTTIFTLLSFITSMSAIAQDMLDIKPLSFNFNPTTVKTVKQSLANPSTWKTMPNNVNLCVFAPGGSTTKGMEYAIKMTEQLPQISAVANKFGINFKVTKIGRLKFKTTIYSPKLKLTKNTIVTISTYSDEQVASEDFKNKRCDGVVTSTLRAKQFNRFVGSLDSVGSVTSYKQMQSVISALANPYYADKMQVDDYEVVGIIPAGAAYAMVGDRKLNSLAKIAGKKIAVLDFDPSQEIMVQNLGAQAVKVDISSFGGAFNNGQVDVIVAPAILYDPLELYKGVAPNGVVKGAVINYPLMQVTATMLVHHSIFPKGVGQLMREFGSQNLSLAFELIKQAESSIPQNHWLNLPSADIPGYGKMLRETRISMTQKGFYQKDMMTLLKKVRCKDNPNHYECHMSGE